MCPCKNFPFDTGRRLGIPALGIVITDGISNLDHKRTVPAADAARANGILMLAIGITPQIHQEELHNIATDPDEDFVFKADDFNMLASIRNQVLAVVCKAVSGEEDDPD
jgi:collagen type VI alpha